MPCHMNRETKVHHNLSGEKGFFQHEKNNNKKVINNNWKWDLIEFPKKKI